MAVIKSCDGLEIFVLVDNKADAMFSYSIPEKHVEQLPPGINCLGEHGLALYLKIKKASKEFNVLFDTGSVNHSILHNWNKLMIDPASIDALVISHGHFDHWGSILEVLDHVSDIPIYLHEQVDTSYYASKDQTIHLPEGEIDKKVLRKMRREFSLVEIRQMPPMATVLEKIKARNCTIQHVSNLTEIFPGVHATAGVERKNDFEIANKFLSNRTGKWDIADFQEEVQLMVNIRDEGLVVMTGCAHVGILNILDHAKKVTGISRILAAIGGFHLFKAREERMNKTIEYFRKENPAVIAPMHCTGENEFIKIYNALPEITTNACVGTKFKF
ncbi:MAG: MBL fold metallo-hydrolase [Candidatus Helarchaeota archaeon]